MTDEQYQQLLDRLFRQYKDKYARLVYSAKSKYASDIADLIVVERYDTAIEQQLNAELQLKLAELEAKMNRNILPRAVKINELQIGFGLSTVSSQEFDALTSNYYRAYALDRSRLKATTTYQDVQQVLQRASDDNLTIAETAQQIRVEMPNFNRYRAETIARTETMQSIDYAQKYILEKTVREYDVNMRDFTKTWLTAMDERVRATHNALHGTTIEYNDYFSVGSGRAFGPRDAGLPPQESINCRCVTANRLKK